MTASRLCRPALHPPCKREQNFKFLVFLLELIWQKRYEPSLVKVTGFSAYPNNKNASCLGPAVHQSRVKPHKAVAIGLADIFEFDHFITQTLLLLLRAETVITLPWNAGAQVWLKYPSGSGAWEGRSCLRGSWCNVIGHGVGRAR